MVLQVLNDQVVLKLILTSRSPQFLLLMQKKKASCVIFIVIRTGDFTSSNWPCLKAFSMIGRKIIGGTEMLFGFPVIEKSIISVVDV